MSGEPGRLALVIASNCEQLPNSRLPFVPWGADVDVAALDEDEALAVRFHELMTSGPGSCTAVTDVAGAVRDGLLINPTREQADAALLTALDQASQSESVLVLAYIGHGYNHAPGDDGARERHFLQVWDSAADPTSERAPYNGWDPYRLIADERANYPYVAGLMLLIDACYGASALDTIKQWSDKAALFSRDWVSSSADTQSFDGCFTKRLVTLIEAGVPADVHPRRDMVKELATYDVVPIIKAECSKLGQDTVHDPFQLSPQMYIAHNVAAVERLENEGLGVGAIGSHLLALTSNYRPFMAEAVIDAVGEHRCVAVIGGAGSGKSTLAAALRLPPKSAENVIPPGYAHAAAFAELTPEPEGFSKAIEGQLKRRLASFSEATQRFRAQVPDWDGLSSLDGRLLGPLRLVIDPIRLVVDGLDHLPTGSPIHDFFATILDDADLAHVSLILTGRPEARIPNGIAVVQMGGTTEEVARDYLSGRGVEQDSMQDMLTNAAGNWLVLELEASAAAVAQGAGDQAQHLYSRLLDAATNRFDWTSEVSPLLAILTAAGSGPKLPTALLRRASQELSGPSSFARIHQILSAPGLSRLVETTDPGTRNERVGLFHPTLASYLTQPEDEAHRLDIDAAHAALLAALEELAPSMRDNPLDPLHQYGQQMEAEHAFALGDDRKVVQVLDERGSADPEDQRLHLLTWRHRLESRGDVDPVAALLLEALIHLYTAWNAPERIDLAERIGAIVGELAEIVGPHGHQTLMTRYTTGLCLERVERLESAKAIYEELIPEIEEVLRDELGYVQRPGDEIPPDHPLSIYLAHSRHELALMERDDDRAIAGLRSAVAGYRVLLGRYSDITLTASDNLAQRLYDSSRSVTEAMELSDQVVADRIAAYGRLHPATVFARRTRMKMEQENGTAAARAMGEALLADAEAGLGRLHLETLITMQLLSEITAIGATTEDDKAGAVALAREVARRYEELAGARSVQAMRGRRTLGRVLGQVGRRIEAAEQLEATAPLFAEATTPTHDEVLATLADAALLRYLGGDPEGAARNEQQVYALLDGAEPPPMARWSLEQLAQGRAT